MDEKRTLGSSRKSRDSGQRNDVPGSQEHLLSAKRNALSHHEDLSLRKPLGEGDLS